ncbi:MAG TPA: hypothetical protein VHL30_01325, partial [Chlamydiales bacterium]|nr:hypothetical protein [Chlamydiales bacterium]
MKIILIGSFIFLLFNSLEAEQNRYRLYCFYTPQFQTLYENHFLPSLKDDFEIVAKQFEQECPSGLFHSAGWNKTMLRKLEMLREAILDHWDR